MHIGVRAHDFGRLPAGELAARIAAKGLSCVQLALSKAIAGLDLRPGDLNPGLAFHIGQAFHRHGLQIAVLGCYVNPIHPDAETRRALLDFFKEHLRFARDFGCGLVALETGSINADYSFHPDNPGETAFQLFLAGIASLVEEAEKSGVIVGIEGVTTHVVSTPARMAKVLGAIGSNHLQVVFDPVNLLSADNYRDQDAVIKEAFDLFRLAGYYRQLAALDLDLFCVPLADTAFNRGKTPLKAIEAAALGLPCIVSDVAPYRGVLSEVTGHLLVENTAAAWSAALDRLTSNDMLRLQLATAGRAWAATKTIEAVGPLWEKFWTGH